MIKMTLTKAGKKLDKSIEKKLKRIKIEFMKLFSSLEEKDILFTLDIKHEKKSFMRFCV